MVRRNRPSSPFFKQPGMSSVPTTPSTASLIPVSGSILELHKPCRALQPRPVGNPRGDVELGQPAGHLVTLALHELVDACVAILSG